MFVEVIIPLALPKNYTWQVPEQMQLAIAPGIRVEVALRKNKKYAGIVKRIVKEIPAQFTPSPILNILDSTPVVNEIQLKLWEWIAQYYMCTEGEVMQAAIPANLKLSSESVLQWNEERTLDFSDLSDSEFIIAEALEIKGELKISEVQQLLDINNTYPVIKKLVEKGVCFVWEELKEKYKQKTENYILLHPKYAQENELEQLLNNWSRAPKQMELLLAYLHLKNTIGVVTQPDLLKKANASAAQLKGLIEKGILIAERRNTDRLPSLPKLLSLDFTLSAAQLSALASIKQIFESKTVCLLHGITASGKTQVYMKLIEEQIQLGKQVLYLLPEIALTAQMIRRLQKSLGGHIAIYHSKFNPNERVEIWNKINSGETKVVLGARSALFLPFNNLGLIICDEEHDASYKQQEPAPRYHSRDAAIYYASLFKTKVLLGSATPSIETYFNVQQNKYGLVELLERYGDVAMPAIELIDLKQIPAKQRSETPLSPALLKGIQETLDAKKQIILFQNRRGYAPYMICDTCGWIPHCNHCDVTLTFHKGKQKLSCHYCGTTYPILQTCMACGNHHFVQKNFGTEKIEELVSEAFPQAVIARMDYDSVKGKHDHDNLIKIFEQHRIDILVGTQMVVKGLDFEKVSLVGIIDADGILNFTDFRVNERAYQLMEQVSGRAGRKDGLGKVMVQVSNLKHPVLQFVQQHNYQALYQFEIENRQQFHYPPFTRLIQVIFKHKDKHVAEEAANIMQQGLSKQFGAYLNGPSQPIVDRIRNQFIWEILLKLPKDSHIVNNCKIAIHQQMVIIQTNKRYRSVHIIPNADPIY
ncbi:primosomal protein N' [Sediminibacterium sp.]|uniref:replication restart helicase PriA n=1 Tax=Sediminibacterium sp. TaxID=1917865 RepID=UPI00273505F0|nr:primosomal protein N' [Sediminibacterium sp.]MDP3392787.1 primosomal protein N' [Sediminibacterium sp.]MDP3565909.1 primosomal protein N' [Sediminibacterium sp.]